MNKACSVITKGSEKQWVPHSPDFNPLDFWFWGACKDSDSVYHNKPGSLEELRVSVDQYVREVTADTVERWASASGARSDGLQLGGAHFEHMRKHKRCTYPIFEMMMATSVRLRLFHKMGII
ncbi:hypothetical protein FJT64_016257 [Amphibalanus amphitrite]|uniref:Uncharacterized protein n=1 Tax=Amphibalanus amphitrite TaxID=1232801 RepID=A0A6A4XF27_AMPAM|nr:hypothetical protein FJT64_016257 [Amphibalanus amphitrite]